MNDLCSDYIQSTMLNAQEEGSGHFIMQEEKPKLNCLPWGTAIAGDQEPQKNSNISSLKKIPRKPLRNGNASVKRQSVGDDILQ